MILILLAVVVAFGAFLAFGERLLFRWYCWELRRVAVAEAPGEAVISYPLA
jgi:hypothetical protein